MLVTLRYIDKPCWPLMYASCSVFTRSLNFVLAASFMIITSLHMLLASCFLIQLHSCLKLFLIGFFPFSYRPSLFSFIHLNRSLLLIDLSSSPHLLSSLIHFASFPGMSGTGHGHPTSCPFFALYVHVHYLGINAYPLLLLLNFSSAHSSATQSSCVFSSSVATCILETVCNLHLTGHSLHMLMTYLVISLSTKISLTLPQHFIMIITHSITVLPLWLSCFLRSALVLLHTVPSVAQPTLQGHFCSHAYPGPHFLESMESRRSPTSLFR